ASCGRPTRTSSTSQRLNAPRESTTLAAQDVIEVIDPTHPLYRRRFPLLWLCQPPQGPGFVEVPYGEYIRLRLPLAATDRAPSPEALPRTKLTPAAIQQLIALGKE